MQLPNNPSQSPETFCNFVEVHAAQRFDLRFLRRFRAGLSIRKSSSFLPPLIRSNKPTSRPAQASPDGPRYFGGTFLPRNALPPLQPTKAIALSILSNCFSISARCSRLAADRHARRSKPPGVSSIARVSSTRADRACPMATHPHHPWGCWIFAGRAARSRSNNLVISTTEQRAHFPTREVRRSLHLDCAGND